LAQNEAEFIPKTSRIWLKNLGLYPPHKSLNSNSFNNSPKELKGNNPSSAQGQRELCGSPRCRLWSFQERSQGESQICIVLGAQWLSTGSGSLHFHRSAGVWFSIAGCVDVCMLLLLLLLLLSRFLLLLLVVILVVGCRRSSIGRRGCCVVGSWQALCSSRDLPSELSLIGSQVGDVVAPGSVCGKPQSKPGGAVGLCSFLGALCQYRGLNN